MELHWQRVKEFNADLRGAGRFQRKFGHTRRHPDPDILCGRSLLRRCGVLGTYRMASRLGSDKRGGRRKVKGSKGNEEGTMRG